MGERCELRHLLAKVLIEQEGVRHRSETSHADYISKIRLRIMGSRFLECSSNSLG